jgi:hypothetical protein
MQFLQTHGMTVGLYDSFEHPPLERRAPAEKAMATEVAIVLKNYARLNLTAC